MRAAAALALALLATGAARDPFEGRVPGAPQRCIRAGLSSSILDDGTIMFRDGRRLWRTGPVGQCTTLRTDQTLVVDVFGGQICRNDRFRLRDPGLSIPSADCRFRDFVPYTRAQ
jgi:hypothetical protein